MLPPRFPRFPNNGLLEVLGYIEFPAMYCMHSNNQLHHISSGVLVVRSVAQAEGVVLNKVDINR